MLAAEFAPVSTTGCHRTVKFATHLPDAGVIPTVVTVREDEGAAYFRTRLDPAIGADLPAGVQVERYPIDWNPVYQRSPFRNRLRVLTSVSENLGRFPEHVLGGIDALVERDRPKVLYVTLPPFSMGRLAIAVKERTGLPLVVDMRDAWAFWGNTPFTTRFHFEAVRRREREILRAADRVVTVTPQLARMLIEANGLDAGRVDVLPNGFDGEVNLSDATLVPAAEADEIRILYVGSFYYSPATEAQASRPWYQTRPNRWLHYRSAQHNWKYRSPYYFLRALAEAVKRAPELRERIVFEYAGNTPAWLPDMVAAFGLAHRFRDHGFLTRDALLPLLDRAHAFLSTSEKVDDGEHYSLPSKLFEYLRYPKPILGFVTAGVQRDFLERSGRGVVIDPDDPRADARLAEVLTDGVTLRTDRDYLARYHRRHTAERLADILRAAAGMASPSTAALVLA